MVTTNMKKASELIRTQIGNIQPVIAGDIESARRAQDKIGEIGAKVLARDVTFVPQIREPYQADFAIPTKAEPGAVILYLHGGAYTAGSLDYARGFGGVLSNLTKLTTLCVAYRLAPENPYPAALEDALSAYKFLQAAFPQDKIFLCGESAGGGLCYALCLKLKELGLAQPRAVVAMSPWTDLAMSLPSHRIKAGLDPCLSTSLIDSYADMYAGTNRTDPLVSPLYGDLRGLPDSLIFVGSYEVLMDDSVVMAEKLEEAGCSVELHVEEGGWHVYVLYAVYEARQALKRMKEFFEEKRK